MKSWLLLLALPAAVAMAVGPAERKVEKQAELKEVKERIEDLRKELTKSEGSRSSVADQLREAESAISTANRRLKELGESRAETRAELAELESQQQRLTQQTASQQAQLGRLLRQQHHADTAGGGDALQTLIKGRDPNLAARDWHFLTLLSRAKAELIRSLSAAAAEKRQLAGAARVKAEEIARIEARQQEERATLMASMRERQAVLARIADHIRVQRREIDTLKRDEQRLGKLIDGLAKLAAKMPRRKPAKAPSVAPKGGEPRAAPAHPVREADTAGTGGAFASLRGKLKLPVKGTLAGRFGTARAEGGAWKGLFIRAGEGAEVRAVAAGRVVFADWLRGFGNLLIIDHDDGFLSVYGNNQSLLRQPGADARAGEVVATVGNSGGNPESGLYFELRHRGQVFDPMKWVAR
ncbi:MAG: peptidoglycan DD-metalloendopeptidase family protein [Sulfurisoma sp.]|nr:peptidoglycan DD-metalloendopeptidase family protein [Sulfurisoma sp.]